MIYFDKSIRITYGRKKFYNIDTWLRLQETGVEQLDPFLEKNAIIL
jgi:hypothetical protein